MSMASLKISLQPIICFWFHWLAILFCRRAVPNLFGTRDWFRGRQFFQGPGWGGWGGGRWGWGDSSVVMWVMGSDGEQQMNLWCVVFCGLGVGDPCGRLSLTFLEMGKNHDYPFSTKLYTILHPKYMADLKSNC